MNALNWGAMIGDATVPPWHVRAHPRAEPRPSLVLHNSSRACDGDARDGSLGSGGEAAHQRGHVHARIELEPRQRAAEHGQGPARATHPKGSLREGLRDALGRHERQRDRPRERVAGRQAHHLERVHDEQVAGDPATLVVGDDVRVRAGDEPDGCVRRPRQPLLDLHAQRTAGHARDAGARGA